MKTEQTGTARSVAALNLAVMLFGLAAVIGRFVQAPSVVIAGGRVICSAAVLLALSLLSRTSLRLANKRDLGLAVFAGLVLALHWTTFFQAIQVSSVAMGTITFSAFPLFLTVLEPLVFRERLRLEGVLEAIALLAGVMITLPPDGLGSGAAAGAGWGMLSGLAYAVLSLANRHLSARYPARVVCLYEQGTAAVALLPAVLLWRGEWTMVGLCSIGVLGVVCTALAHSLYVAAQRRVSAQAAGVVFRYGDSLWNSVCAGTAGRSAHRPGTGRRNTDSGREFCGFSSGRQTITEIGGFFWLHPTILVCFML